MNRVGQIVGQLHKRIVVEKEDLDVVWDVQGNIDKTKVVKP
jgi:hypothetical protein